jgi:hypothetical protein
MWYELKEWLKDGGSIGDDGLVDELSAPEAYINRRGKLQLESKDDMKKRGLLSPNKADALALTFAYPVQPGANTRYRQMRRHGRVPKAGSM